MINLSRGMRDKISKYANTSQPIVVDMSISGSSEYDFCLFGVDANEKLSDDRYMIFFNQLSSPEGAMTLEMGQNSARYTIWLDKLPQTINKLIFTVSIDGDGTMGNIASHKFVMSQNGAQQIEMALTGSDFSQEKAIISVEMYRKDEWRIAAAAKGFNGGLSALLANYGGEEIDDEPAAAAPVQQAPAQANVQPVPAAAPVSLKKTEKEITEKVMGKISLSKDKKNLEQHVVSLSKCIVNLSKTRKTDLGDMRARVAVVLDYSGSMGRLYRNGTVQKTLNRLVPLGLTFDDNGSIDLFLFQSDYRQMEDLTLRTYDNYVQQVIMASDYRMGGTAYAPVLRAMIEGTTTVREVKKGLFGTAQEQTHIPGIVDNTMPTFILFITDGDNSDKPETDEIIRRSSGMNVFIQFIGIGRDNFGYLEQLDNMQGRVRDNTGFSKMEDLERASDDELFTNVLGQFSEWLDIMQVR